MGEKLIETCAAQADDPNMPLDSVEDAATNILSAIGKICTIISAFYSTLYTNSMPLTVISTCLLYIFSRI